MQVVVCAIKLTKTAHEDRLQILHRIRSDLRVEKVQAGDANDERNLKTCLELMGGIVERHEAFDLLFHVFGINMNKAVAQRLAAAVLGSLATVGLKIATSSMGQEEEEH